MFYYVNSLYCRINGYNSELMGYKRMMLINAPIYHLKSGLIFQYFLNKF